MVTVQKTHTSDFSSGLIFGLVLGSFILLRPQIDWGLSVTIACTFSRRMRSIRTEPHSAFNCAQGSGMLGELGARIVRSAMVAGTFLVCKQCGS